MLKLLDQIFHFSSNLRIILYNFLWYLPSSTKKKTMNQYMCQITLNSLNKWCKKRTHKQQFFFMKINMFDFAVKFFFEWINFIKWFGPNVDEQSCWSNIGKKIEHVLMIPIKNYFINILIFNPLFKFFVNQLHKFLKKYLYFCILKMYL
jgi:hypothetical protein